MAPLRRRELEDERLSHEAPCRSSSAVPRGPAGSPRLRRDGARRRDRRSSTASSCDSRRGARSRCTAQRAAFRYRRRAPTVRRSEAAAARRSPTSRRRTPSRRSRHRARRSSSASLCGVVAPEKASRDFGDQGLESLVPAIFLRVEPAVASHDPTDVARPMRAEHDGRGIRRRLAEQRLDGAHRCDESRLRRLRHRRQQRRDLVMRGAIEGRERLPPRGSDRQLRRRASPSREPCARNPSRRTRAGCGSSILDRARGAPRGPWRRCSPPRGQARRGRALRRATRGCRRGRRRSMPMRCV